MITGQKIGLKKDQKTTSDHSKSMCIKVNRLMAGGKKKVTRYLDKPAAESCRIV